MRRSHSAATNSSCMGVCVSHSLLPDGSKTFLMSMWWCEERSALVANRSVPAISAAELKEGRGGVVMGRRDSFLEESTLQGEEREKEWLKETFQVVIHNHAEANIRIRCQSIKSDFKDTFLGPMDEMSFQFYDIDRGESLQEGNDGGEGRRREVIIVSERECALEQVDCSKRKPRRNERKSKGRTMD